MIYLVITKSILYQSFQFGTQYFTLFEPFHSVKFYRVEQVVSPAIEVGLNSSVTVYEVHCGLMEFGKRHAWLLRKESIPTCCTVLFICLINTVQQVDIVCVIRTNQMHFFP